MKHEVTRGSHTQKDGKTGNGGFLAKPVMLTPIPVRS